MTPCTPPPLQDKVVNSISELYSFMDSADATLALKVLGEVDENGETVQEQSEGEQAVGVLCCTRVTASHTHTHWRRLSLVDRGVVCRSS